MDDCAEGKAAGGHDLGAAARDRRGGGHAARRHDGGAAGDRDVECGSAGQHPFGTAFADGRPGIKPAGAHDQRAARADRAAESAAAGEDLEGRAAADVDIAEHLARAKFDDGAGVEMRRRRAPADELDGAAARDGRGEGAAAGLDDRSAAALDLGDIGDRAAFDHQHAAARHRGGSERRTAGKLQGAAVNVPAAGGAARAAHAPGAADDLESGEALVLAGLSS